MDQLTLDEQDQLVSLIRSKHGFNLTQRRFTEVAFALFEDISGMEGISTPNAMEIINTLWKNYCVQTKI